MCIHQTFATIADPKNTQIHDTLRRKFSTFRHRRTDFFLQTKILRLLKTFSEDIIYYVSRGREKKIADSEKICTFAKSKKKIILMKRYCFVLLSMLFIGMVSRAQYIESQSEYLSVNTSNGIVRGYSPAPYYLTYCKHDHDGRFMYTDFNGVNLEVKINQDWDILDFRLVDKRLNTQFFQLLPCSLLSEK